ncbi:hypothetical protein CHM34_15290 [Paludifilum halophilum]|uniref:Uncharacterized protein n=1 Tax=Paludifilum halophilum TaxID=1642702 RepID=A0A235B430_9BACL|nr:hypothetical protein CHM34_15290 [Paludifilum halophilum]
MIEMLLRKLFVSIVASLLTLIGYHLISEANLGILSLVFLVFFFYGSVVSVIAEKITHGRSLTYLIIHLLGGISLPFLYVWIDATDLSSLRFEDYSKAVFLGFKCSFLFWVIDIIVGNVYRGIKTKKRG